MKNLQKKQKPLIFLLVIAQVFTFNIAPVFALFGGGPSIPSTSSMLSEMEKRYHLNTGALQDQGESMNVASGKALVPEVMIYFSPNDPREGEKITAKAFPMYFSNAENALYYTWTLKRKGCNLGSSSVACDEDGDRIVTVEDWKIAAARIIALNGYTSDLGPSVNSDTDKDGYKAYYGGDDKLGMLSHCYVNDSVTGKSYELGKSSNIAFGCPNGTSPVCMVSNINANPGTFTTSTSSDGMSGTASSSLSGSFFSYSSTTCSVSGYPACSSTTPICTVGEPRCVVDPFNTSSCGSILASCSADTGSSVNLYCRHLFPKMPGYTSGDGTFSLGEEQSWGTNPADSSTADNENKDEANIVGLNQSSFTWNYQSGDKVGVVVEGTSMMPTKYDDSSSMVIWAFSKKDCPLSLADSTGAYVKSIKGYSVTLPVADINLNKCIERNLIDPREGGQATRLDVSVSASSSEAINDPGFVNLGGIIEQDKSGDLLTVQSIITNLGKSLSNVLFKWRVDIATNINGFSNNTATNITSDLQDLGLLSNSKGNALDTISLKLDIPINKMQGYVGNAETAYLRFRLDAEESFPDGGVRKGNSDVIVKILSTAQKIVASKVSLVDDDGQQKISGLAFPICNSDPSDRTICRVIKNEIIGLKIDDPNLSNFSWTINDTPLVCTSRVSNLCQDDRQKDINFFPVTGNVGDTYTVVVTANNTATGKSVTLTRAFNIVEPKVVIKSADMNVLWPKYLGKYKDVANLMKQDGTPTCPGGYCDDYSESVFQAYDGNTVGLNMEMIPNFLINTAITEWTINNESVPVNPTPPPLVSFLADQATAQIYKVDLFAQYTQGDDVRKALLDIWGISPFDSPEIKFSSSLQIEVQDALLTDGPLVGPRKYYAAIASYIPASLLFTFRIVLSVVLLLFVVNILYSFLEQKRVEEFVETHTRSKR